MNILIAFLIPTIFVAVGGWILVKRDARFGALMVFSGLALFLVAIVAVTTNYLNG